MDVLTRNFQSVRIAEFISCREKLPERLLEQTSRPQRASEVNAELALEPARRAPGPATASALARLGGRVLSIRLSTLYSSTGMIKTDRSDRKVISVA